LVKKIDLYIYIKRVPRAELMPERSSFFQNRHKFATYFYYHFSDYELNKKLNR